MNKPYPKKRIITIHKVPPKLPWSVCKSSKALTSKIPKKEGTRMQWLQSWMVYDLLVVRCRSCNFRSFLFLIPILNIVLATHFVSWHNEGCIIFPFSVLFFVKYSAACAWTEMKMEFTLIKWQKGALKCDVLGTWNLFNSQPKKELILIDQNQNRLVQKSKLSLDPEHFILGPDTSSLSRDISLNK